MPVQSHAFIDYFSLSYLMLCTVCSAVLYYGITLHDWQKRLGRLHVKLLHNHGIFVSEKKPSYLPIDCCFLNVQWHLFHACSGEEKRLIYTIDVPVIKKFHMKVRKFYSLPHDTFQNRTKQSLQSCYTGNKWIESMIISLHEALDLTTPFWLNPAVKPNGRHILAMFFSRMKRPMWSYFKSSLI